MVVSKQVLAVVLFFVAITAHADEVVLIVNPSNALSEMHLTDVQKIFLGKKKFFPGGGRVIPADQSKTSVVRASFYKDIIGKSKSQLKTYWSRRIFTGRGVPPIIKNNDKAMLAWVAEQPLALGYVYKSLVNDSVKVLTIK